MQDLKTSFTMMRGLLHRTSTMRTYKVVADTAIMSRERPSSTAQLVKYYMCQYFLY